MSLPVQTYNLARLGHAGDEVRFEADEAGRAAIAQWSEVVSVERFAVQVTLRKAAPDRYSLDYRLEAEATQACVVTLEPLKVAIERSFTRELHFSGVHRRPAEPDSESLEISGLEEDVPEEIESLHVDLAAPALEEYLLALDPYPRRPGAEFSPDAAGIAPLESPFAVLKNLKNRP